MNDTSLVTRAILKEELQKELQNCATKDDLARIDQRFDRVHESIDRVLSVVISMNNSLAPMVKDHERRIKRLEKSANVA